MTAVFAYLIGFGEVELSLSETSIPEKTGGGFL